MASRPSVKAILICDDIIHEAVTNKKSLIGIFEDIHVPDFPCQYPRIAVYVNLTDAHGRYRLELKLVDSSDGSVIGSGATPEVDIDSPLRTCEFALKIQNLVFKQAGHYEFQIFANQDLVGTKSFNVKQSRGRRAPPFGPPPAEEE